MKITSISYKKIFPLEAYKNETIGVEVQVDEGEDPYKAFEMAKNYVEGWHLIGDKYVTGTALVNGYNAPIDKPHTDDIPVIQINGDGGDDAYSRLILSTKSPEQLASLKKDLPPKFMPEYMTQLKKLTPKSI